MSTRRWVFLSVAVLLGGLTWINARFVLLAIETQPGCVPHERGTTGAASRDGTGYRAAKSSC